MATLTAVAQEAARDSTSRGTPPPTTQPVNPNNPYPGTTTPGGPYGSTGSTMNLSSYQNLSNAEALAVIAAIDSNEITAGRFVENRKVGKHHTSTTGTSGTSGGTYGGSSGTSGGTYGSTTTKHSTKSSTGMSSSTGTVKGDVEDFAEHLRKDHEKNLKDAMALAKKLNLTISSAGEPVRMVREEGMKGMAKLKSASGMELERTYVNAMVNGHQQVLQIIDTMTGTATSTSTTSSSTDASQQLSQQVRDFLTQTRTVVAEHLQKAQELQGQVSMGQSGSNK